jgi:hypothetical protein
MQNEQKISIHWAKLESENLFMKKIRDQLFNVITKYMADSNGLLVKDFPKDETHYSVIIYQGTKEDCNKEYLKIQKIGATKVNGILNALRSSKVYQVLVPRYLKNKFTNVHYDPDVSAFEQLSNKLLFVHISVFVTQNDVL